MNSKKLPFYILPTVFLQILLLCISVNSSSQVNTWQQKQSFGGTGRTSAVAFSIGTKGYIGTGYDIAPTKDFWEYDPTTDTWAQKADFAGGERNHAAGFSIGNKGYVGTGLSLCMCENTKDFWEYNPATNVWTRKADFAGPSRHVAVGLSIGNKGYIGTGTTHGYSLYNDFWEYDPITDTWTQKADFAGGARYYAVAFGIGTKGYVGTGTDFTSGGFTFRKDFWEYDQSTDNWTRKADLGGPGREGAVGFNIQNKGFISTGYGAPNDLWEYTPSIDTWVQKPDYPGGGSFAGSGFSIGSTGYMGLGFGANGRVNDLWAYTMAIPTIACSNNNTVLYYGYSGDQTATITGTPSGGIGPYSVTITMNRPLKCNVINSSGNEIWVSGAGTSSTVNTICPTSTGAPSSTANNITQGNSYSVNVTLMANAIFTITTTDALGYSSSCTTKISAEDVRCFAGNSANYKATICHKTGSQNNPCVKICVDQSAVQEHLDHGDFLGKCTSNCEPTTPSLRGGEISSQQTSEIGGALKLDIQALPMPSKSSFSLKVQSDNSKDKMEIKIVDVSGKLVEKISKVFVGQNLQIGNNYKPGVYILELTQGINKKQIKLIKL